MTPALKRNCRYPDYVSLLSPCPTHLYLPSPVPPLHILIIWSPQLLHAARYIGLLHAQAAALHVGLAPQLVAQLGGIIYCHHQVPLHANLG